MENYILQKILMIPAILIGFTVHEYSHALVADKLGDKTPKFQGRLTLNPISHIDLIGFIMILFFGFGYAKPVEVNPRAFKHYYKDDLKVSFAGPFSNLVTAFIFAILYGILDRYVFSLSAILSYIQIIFLYIIQINCMLFLFNLIPIPSLDGFHILRDLYPKYFYKIQEKVYRYQLLILLIFIFPLPGLQNSLAWYIIGIPSYGITNLFIKIGMIIFGVM